MSRSAKAKSENLYEKKITSTKKGWEYSSSDKESALKVRHREFQFQYCQNKI
jgi:hypothetical protein